MKHLLKIVLLISGAFSLVTAIEIDSVYVTPPGESEPRKQPFIRVDSKKVMFPLRSAYKKQISNDDKSIWAINYHETSNFESVDLAISVEDRIFMLPNVWSLIQSEVFAQKVLPRITFDHIYFEITSVEQNALHARFRGTSARDQQEIDRTFLIIASINKQGVDLRLK